jgi:putative transcriptional regulator
MELTHRPIAPGAINYRYFGVRAARKISMHKTRSLNIEALHDRIKGLEMAGDIDQVTMRDFDPQWLPLVGPLEPAEIKRIREGTHVSQAVFARLLNTSLSTVQKWEIGQKKPAGTALKLLHLVQKRGLEVIA